MAGQVSHPTPRGRAERNGRFLVAVAGLCCAAAIGVGAERAWFLRHSATADGEVVAVRRDRLHGRGGPSTIYLHTVSFVDPHGAPHRIELPPQDARHPVGSTIPLRFPPDRPEMARPGGTELWTIPLGLLAVGGFLLCIAASLIFGGRWLLARGCSRP